MFTNNLQNKDLSKQKKATTNEDDLVTSFKKTVNIKKYGCETKKRNTSIFSFTEEANVNTNKYDFKQDIDEVMNMLIQVGPIFIQNTNTINQVSPIMTEEHFCGDSSVEEYNLVFKRNINRDQRRYNSPTASEIAMVFSDPNGEPPFDRDVRIYTKGKGFDSEHLNILSPHIDPMSYVLLFPHGETGWQPNLALSRTTMYFKRYQCFSIR